MRGASAEDKEAGAEIELTPGNAVQILQSPSALLVQVGTLSDAARKKGLQIKSSPTVLLMARGQVAAALENDFTPTAVTGFVENVAKALGLKMDLDEDVGEQLLGAEELEWSEPATAEEAFESVSQAPDLANDARVRAAAGRVRCSVRQAGREGEAKEYLQELEAAGHSRVPEVKQAAAMMQLLEHRPEAEVQLDALEAASSAEPANVAAAQAYVSALFWRGDEGKAVDVGLKVLKKNPKSDAVRQLVKDLVEALGPRHPRKAAARRAFSNALFI